MQGYGQAAVVDKLNASHVAAMQSYALVWLAWLAACKTLARETPTAACSHLSILPYAKGPKRSMGHVSGAEKLNFLIRGRGRPTVQGGRASGILSIRGPEVTLGSLRVGTIHVQAPTPPTPPLPN